MQQFGKFFLSDWYIAWPMIAMSITALALVIWRILLYVNGNTNLDEFLPEFQRKLDQEGIAGALKFCRARTDIIPRRLFVAGLDTAKQGVGAMRRAMANIIELEILPDLNFLLPLILAIAKIATMVGLLGTVISMINTFNKIQESIRAGQEGQAGDAGVGGHSGEIGLALFATALGLVTAIPLVFSHVLFKAWVNKFELKMKSAAQKLILLVQNVKTGKAGEPVKSAPGAV
jgi:biopolymer transport protein ExbB